VGHEELLKPRFTQQTPLLQPEAAPSEQVAETAAKQLTTEAL
jgi:hypothetical protein